MDRVMRRIRCKGIMENVYSRQHADGRLGLFFTPLEFDHALRIANGYKDNERREEFWEGVFSSKRMIPGYTVYDNFPLHEAKVIVARPHREEPPTMPPEYVMQKARETLEIFQRARRQNAG